MELGPVARNAIAMIALATTAPLASHFICWRRSPDEYRQVSFRNERVDLTVDGQRLQRPVTPWS
jgi:hypothetical protein